MQCHEVVLQCSFIPVGGAVVSLVVLGPHPHDKVFLKAARNCLWTKKVRKIDIP